jgi:NADPH:quinone reductase-like Zn-dependent oxidoreductase
MATSAMDPDTTMKALVRQKSGSADPLLLSDTERPLIIDHHVLIRVRAASVNAADWHMFNGGRMAAAIAWALRTPLPPVRGTDLAGVVVAVGSHTTRFKPGDEVFGSGLGSLAEYALAKEDRLAPKPQQLSFGEAASLPIAGVTALQGLRDKAHVQPGQRVLVYGAGGGVGTFAVQLAGALGATVTAVTSIRNLDLVQTLGAAEVVDYTKEDVTQRDQRYEVIFDVAAIRPLSDLTRVLEPGGMLVLAGAAKGGMLDIVGRLAGAQLRSRFRGQRVITFLAHVTQEDLKALAELAEAGDLRPAIDREYPLAEAGDAIRYLGSGQARAKVVINVD